jgi:hypothetical protein
VEAFMPVGDAILFRGRVHNHWRDQLPADWTEGGSILFHFVHTDFDLASFQGKPGQPVEPF